MPRGVKQIALDANQWHMKNMTIPNGFVLKGGVPVNFIVYAWLPDTTPVDKGNVKWMLQDRNRNAIITKFPGTGYRLERFNISRKLSGSQQYYLEASLSGERDFKNPAGIYLRAWAPQLVISSKWSLNPDGPALGKTSIEYGDDVVLYLNTEGLNGNQLIIDVYNRVVGKNILVKTYINVPCEGGEVNYTIRDTSSWYSKTRDVAEREFFITVKDQASKQIILDNKKDQYHARFLRIKGRKLTNNVAPPVNNTAGKIGQQPVNTKRYEPCGFKKIEINDGKRFLLFDEGKIGLKGMSSDGFSKSMSIHFDFNKWNITSGARSILNELAEYLFQNPYLPVELGAHTDVRGTDAFNDELSNKRAQSAVDYLINKGIDKRRISAKGYGKRALLHKGENVTEAQHAENRRVTIKFKIYENNAETILFETVSAGESVKKKIMFNIADYTSPAGCIHSNGKHQAAIMKKIDSQRSPNSEWLTVTAGEKNDKKADDRIYSPMDNKLVAFDYFIPHLQAPKSFFYYINSCRYFSDKNRPTVLVRAYSDIRWKFRFFVNMSSPLNLDWSNIPVISQRYENLKKTAQSLGKSYDEKTSGIDWGVELNADWNHNGTKYTKNDNYTLKFEGKIKDVFNLITSVRDITRALGTATGGKVRKMPFVGKIPLQVSILAPKFAIALEWYLAHGKKKNVETNNLGTEFLLDVYSDPIIGLEITFDLLGLAVTAASVAATGNTVAADLFDYVRRWSEKGVKNKYAEVKLNMYLDAVFTGTVSGGVKNGIINTASDQVQLEAQLETKIGVTLKAGIVTSAKAMFLEYGKASVSAGMTADASVAIRGSYGFKWDSYKGLLFKPGLVLDPCVAKVAIFVQVGLSYKVVSADWKPVNFNENRTFWEKIDVMQKLASFSGKPAEFLIYERKN
ncbi:MAG: OmpA family protein [Sphingobacterium sp.]|jgi:outer membrane protein OmpA-like peptidoglycan-associated protein|nr:OmpA family protein [Sphingobacterium sp.]